MMLLILCEVNGSHPHRQIAFSGGFGASSKSPSKPKRKKRGLSEMENLSPRSSEKAETKLDKWGLPPPTEEDIFPYMHPGTELISAPSQTTKQAIENALRDHVPLTLDRFDDNGAEKHPSPGRKPMTIRMLHQSPPVLAIDHFFSDDECAYVQGVTQCASDSLQVDSATFSPLAQSKRTSTSWFCFYEQMPALLAKAHKVLGIPIKQMEEPQIVRYRTGEEFSWHYDEVPPAQLKNGGQRVMTLLVYLNDVSRGGGTIFRDLKDADGQLLTMKPKKGSALLFFPAFKDGRPDDRTLHKGEVAMDEKWITQMWIHQYDYLPVVPQGNTHEAALACIAQINDELGYN